MKILLAGAWAYQIYEPAFAEALRKQGVEVVPFSWLEHFRGFWGRVQGYVPFPSPASRAANAALLDCARKERPDIILVWRGTHIMPRTLRTIRRETGSVLVSYNNDDPFGPRAHGNVPWHHHLLWRWYLASLPDFDCTLVYRPVNVEEATTSGARRVEVFKPYFIPGKDEPVTLSHADRQAHGCDVVFAGHYEPDGRERYLKALVDAGLRVRLHGGPAWSRQVLGDYYDTFAPVREASGEEYSKVLSAATSCLCLLSKRNRDSYTRRCFEIPACGSVMLSERTTDLTQMFREDEEAMFFSDIPEMVEKALQLRDNPGLARRIASAGRERVQQDGHSVDARAGQFVELLGTL